MAKYAWATDVHLDFLANNPQAIVKFAESLVVDNPTGVFLTGDIATAKVLVYNLSALERVVQRPIYFVLGNHDYYGSNFVDVRKAMHEVSNVSPFLRYMPTMPYLALSPSTAVVGHDGWYDAMYGNWRDNSFSLNDWTAIHEFREVNGNRATIVETARKFAHEAVLHVQNSIKQATRYHKNIVVLTHFPPFKESHIFEGRQGDDAALPWYTSKMMGDMLLAAAKAYPTHTFTVLAGHTHGQYMGKFADNLLVHVGGAVYGQPKLQGLIEVA